MIVKNLTDIHPLNQPKQAVNVIKVAPITPDWELGVHHHASGQLMATISGLITLSTDIGIWIIPPKTAIWIPANMQHSATGIGISTCYIVFTSEEQLSHHNCQIIHTNDLFTQLLKRAETMNQNYSSNSPDSRLISVLIDEICHAPPQELYLPLPTDKRLKVLTDTLLHQPDLKISLVKCAEQCHMSERSLTRIFKRETSLSIHDWRRRLHIILALQMLNDRNNITYIANKLGYVSESSFITMFKKVMKYSPKKFMIKYLNEDTENLNHS